MILDKFFITKAMNYKIDIVHRIQVLLQDKVQLFVLQSLIDEAAKLGEKTAHLVEYCNRCCQVIDDSQCSGSNHNEKLLNYLST